MEIDGGTPISRMFQNKNNRTRTIELWNRIRTIEQNKNNFFTDVSTSTWKATTSSKTPHSQSKTPHFHSKTPTKKLRQNFLHFWT